MELDLELSCCKAPCSLLPSGLPRGDPCTQVLSFVLHSPAPSDKTGVSICFVEEATGEERPWDWHVPTLLEAELRLNTS